MGKFAHAFLLTALFTLASTVAFATGQAGDVIYIDGQEWVLLGRPVGYDSVLYSRVVAALPGERSQSTANWDGFQGYWSLDGDRLILDSVVVEVPGDVYYKEYALRQEVMREVFGDYYRGGRIVAAWVTGVLRVAQGKMLLYQHDAWVRHYETEMLLEVEQGSVAKRTLYHNRMVVDGLSLDENTNDTQWEAFTDGFLPILRQHRELDTVDKVYFVLRNCVADSLGHITDIDVEVRYKGRRENVTEVAEEFRQYMMNFYPWRTMLINGEYIAIWRSWMFNIRLK